MDHPFAALPPEQRWQLLLGLCALLVLSAALMAWAGKLLRTNAAPRGVMSLQLAGTTPAAEAILDSWGDSGRVRAAANIGLDFLFIVAYAGLLALACAWVADTVRIASPRMAWIGDRLAWGQLLAGLFDAVENVLLLRVLFDGSPRGRMGAVQLMAMAKFALASAGVAYLLFGGWLVCLVANA